MLLMFLGAIEAQSCPIGPSMLWTGQELNDGGQGVALPNGVRSDGSSTTPLKTVDLRDAKIRNAAKFEQGTDL